MRVFASILLGLVRSGVAPDHPEVKSVQEDFTQVATSMRVKFLGNVSVGEDISLPQLARHYDAVVLAYGAKVRGPRLPKHARPVTCSPPAGAQEDRELGVEGETLHGVYSARQFVNWYNGHPDHAKLGPDLSTESAVIVGQVRACVPAPIPHPDPSHSLPPEGQRGA